MYKLTELDYKIVKASQAGLPLSITPYKDLALSLDILENDLIERMLDLKELGFIRRVALVPNHYKIGYIYNGMTVWQISKDDIERIGELFSQCSFVSHCYQRKTYPGVWDYNLFAMIHGTSKEICDLYLSKLKLIAKDSYSKMDTLYSTKILKKTGLRI